MNDKNNKTKPRIGRSIFLLTVLFRPKAVFEDLAVSEPSPYRVFFKFLIWFAMLPPLFAYIGGSWKGWDLGAENPLVLGETELRAVSAIYFYVSLKVLSCVRYGMILSWALSIVNVSSELLSWVIKNGSKWQLK